MLLERVKKNDQISFIFASVARTTAVFLKDNDRTILHTSAIPNTTCFQQNHIKAAWRITENGADMKGHLNRTNKLLSK